jgi:hypothetical protein
VASHEDDLALPERPTYHCASHGRNDHGIIPYVFGDNGIRSYVRVAADRHTTQDACAGEYDNIVRQTRRSGGRTRAKCNVVK